MSFKYRFILSFVSLEIFFILLIVLINFTAINNSSKQLILQKIDSNSSFIEELIKIPISIYDLATLDNLIQNTTKLNYINSIIILDNTNKIISQKFNFGYLKLEDVLNIKKDKELIFYDKSFEIKYKKLYEEKVYLGSIYIIFDNTENNIFIKETQKNTILIVILEIFISTILSYIIGIRLTNKLTNLSNIARDIGKNKKIDIPYLELNDEIGILSKSLNQMQIDLQNRNKKLKDLAKTLQNQKLELLETQKYKDSFFANMSHELKTPLNSINILSSLMMKNKSGSLDYNEVKNLQIINNCGKNLLNLINDILDISKLEAGEVIVNVFSFDLNKSMQKINDMFQVQIENKGLELLFIMDRSLKLIFNDEKIINQIIINLLSNAIKFTHKGKIEFIVNDKNEYVEFIVKDDGIGIPNDKLNHIFDRFKQVDGSTSRKYGGTGLGLAICKELTAMLLGKISVQSCLDEGSTFTVLIKKNMDSNQIINENDEVIETITYNEVLKQNDEKNSSNILILNNDPLYYLDIVVELKRRFNNVEQVVSIDKMLLKLEKTEYVTIIDLDCIDIDELKEVLKIKSLNLFIICKDKTIIDDELKQYSKIVFEKPLQKDVFLSKLKELNSF